MEGHLKYGQSWSSQGQPAGTAPGGFPISPGVHIDGIKQQIYSIMRARGMTDTYVSILWILIPVLVTIIGAVTIILIGIYESINAIIGFPLIDMPLDWTLSHFALTIISAIIIGIIVSTLFAILTFKLVERQNKHFERESHLRRNIIAMLRSVAGSPEKESTIATELATMNILHGEATGDEVLHSAILWALAVFFCWAFIPISWVLILYMFYFLMKTIYNHDRRWYEFSNQTMSALSKLGYSVAPPYNVRVLQRRSFAIYLILSIITFGLFALYWWYALIQDPNEHFKNQWYLEDHLSNIIAQK
ncbi:MAG: DUF4234 domain-containing protein [Thermoplasmata archaeon]|nr:DUF4234 domain-containing protein [Thermoplasmata archaeon]